MSLNSSEEMSVLARRMSIQKMLGKRILLHPSWNYVTLNESIDKKLVLQESVAPKAKQANNFFPLQNIQIFKLWVCLVTVVRECEYAL